MARNWSNLPINLEIISSFNAFKAAIKGIFCKNKNPVYSMIKHKQQLNLTRIRLGLSALNCQRFTYNLIENPICEICHIAAETPSHFLLECTAYDVSRQSLLFDLQNVIPNDIFYNKNSLCDTLISGTNTLNIEENHFILTRVCMYINETERFLV
jgi:hypothetical protein